MSFAGLPVELVISITAALYDTRDISALMRANSGLYRSLKRFLYQYNVDFENSSGIIRAVRGENLSATSSFLGTERVNLDARDKDGQTVLHIAAQQGDPAYMVILLLRDGRVDINATDAHGRTPLSYSAANPHPSPLTLLLQRQDIDINMADAASQTALFHATKAGNEQATGLLLNRPDLKAHVLDANYVTPVWYAAAGGHEGVVNQLLQCPLIEFRPRNERLSPLITAVDKCHHSVFEILLLSGKVDQHAADPEGRSALWYAVRRRNYAAVQLLIESGVDAGRPGVDGTTPLSLAVAQGDEDLVRMLLKVTASYRLLCLAASTGRAHIVQLLLDHGADIDEEDDYGRTPLDRARKAGHVDVEEVLLKYRSL
ncbi:hypothetical protein NYO67_4571 [Aspergillus flavus]|nr:hypothetical protein NYO67_4571 [Aspergillus flavus]